MLQSVHLRLYPNLDNLAFIQMGAIAENRADPIGGFVSLHTWIGVMLEPVYTSFRTLEANHRYNARLSLVQASVEATEDTRPIFHFAAEYSPLPDWTHGLASLDRHRFEAVVREFSHPDSSIMSTVTGEPGWKRLDDRHCDLLVLDTEDYDLRPLESGNLPAHRTRLSRFEHGYAPMDERIGACHELVALGYETAHESPDTTAWLGSVGTTG